jgi:hypothetical protein
LRSSFDSQTAERIGAIGQYELDSVSVTRPEAKNGSPYERIIAASDIGQIHYQGIQIGKHLVSGSKALFIRSVKAVNTERASSDCTSVHRFHVLGFAVKTVFRSKERCDSGAGLLEKVERVHQVGIAAGRIGNEPDASIAN